MSAPGATELSFLSAVAIAGGLFLLGEEIVERVPLLRRYHFPAPIVGGLLGALGFLLLRGAGTVVEIPTSGRPVDFLVALLTTNMGLHVTPAILRQGIRVFPLFLAAAVVTFFLQLAAVSPLALAAEEPFLQTALLLGPLSFVGIPYNLNPPSQIEPLAALFPAYPELQPLAQGMMMVGVLAGPVVAAVLGTARFRREGEEPPRPSPRERTSSANLWTFSRRETALVVLVLGIVALAFHLQGLLLRHLPGFQDGFLPVIVLGYLLGALFRLAYAPIPLDFPEKEITVLLLGPTMGLVLTYAVMSVPLHRLGLLSAPMVLAGLLAVGASALVAWLLFPLLRRLLDPYYAVVVSIAFLAVTTAFGPVAMSFLHRFTDEEGPVEPMPVILPLNAFYLFPWTVIGLCHLLLG